MPAPDLFEGNQLKSEIRDRILSQLYAAGLSKDKISAYLVGDLVTDRSKAFSPIQVVVTLDDQSADQFNEQIGKYLTSIRFPELSRDCEFGFQNGVINLEDHPAVYDLKHRVWFKGDPRDKKEAASLSEPADTGISPTIKGLDTVSFDVSLPTGVTKDNVETFFRDQHAPGHLVDNYGSKMIRVTCYQKDEKRLRELAGFFLSKGSPIPLASPTTHQVAPPRGKVDLEIDLTSVNENLLDQFMRRWKSTKVTYDDGKIRRYTNFASLRDLQNMKNLLADQFPGIRLAKKVQAAPIKGYEKGWVGWSTDKTPDIRAAGYLILCFISPETSNAEEKYTNKRFSYFSYNTKLGWRAQGHFNEYKLWDSSAEGGFHDRVRAFVETLNDVQQVSSSEEALTIVRERLKAKRIASAFIKDTKLSDLPEETQKEVCQFIDCTPDTLIPTYGMVVDELVHKADPHNLSSAQDHIKDTDDKELEKEVYDKADKKYILLVNDRIIDGHHYLAKAEKAGVSRTLRVLDLTACRFQKKEAQGIINYWLDPDCRLIPARQHIKWLQNKGIITKEDWAIDENSADTEEGLYKKAYGLGYVRVVISYERGELMYEGKPTPRQLKELKDLAIEKGLDLEYDGPRYGQREVEDSVTKLYSALQVKGYKLEQPTTGSGINPNAMSFRGYIYPTIVSPDGYTKLSLDKTTLFERNGDPWYGSSDHYEPNYLTLSVITTDPSKRGQGLAKAVMNDVTAAADEVGIRLRLEPAPVKEYSSKGDPKKEDLVNWYQNHGFQPLSDRSIIMERQPKSNLRQVSKHYSKKRAQLSNREAQLQPSILVSPRGDIKKGTSHLQLAKSMFPDSAQTLQRLDEAQVDEFLLARGYAIASLFDGGSGKTLNLLSPASERQIDRLEYFAAMNDYQFNLSGWGKAKYALSNHCQSLN